VNGKLETLWKIVAVVYLDGATEENDETRQVSGI
jgi:hypothetical protein